jgi:hypothetical protein
VHGPAASSTTAGSMQTRVSFTEMSESRRSVSAAPLRVGIEEGHLVMYELGVVLEMKPCDIILFPDSLITHKNTKVKGRRKSVVAFTQAC